MAKPKQTQQAARKVPNNPNPKSQRQRLTDYIRRLADLLDLKDWLIELHDAPADGATMAQVNSVKGTRNGTIWIAYNWQDWNPEKLRYVIVHELLHLHWEPAWNYVFQVSSESDYNSFKYIAEYAIDATARAIATHYPLFDWRND